MVESVSELRLRVLHVNLLPPGLGGIERLLISFLKQCNAAKFDIRLAILDHANDLVDELRGDGHKIYALERKRDRFDWGLFSRLTRLVREVQPDVIHVHGTSPLLFAVPAAIRGGHVPVVYTCHFSRPNPNWRRRMWFRTALKGVRSAVGVSHAARNVLVEHYGMDPRKCSVIANGVNMEQFQAESIEPVMEQSGFVVGFCGVFRPEKQIHLLLQAMVSVRTALPEAHLLLIGDGPESHRCEELVDELQLRDCVTFAGRQSDIRPWVVSTDVMVLPSREEAMPVALIEAQALGRPCVASAVGGIREVIEDEQTGILVESGDVDGLAKALIRLGANPALREQYARAARKRMEKSFSERQMIEGYERLYQSVVGRTATNHGVRAEVEVCSV